MESENTSSSEFSLKSLVRTILMVNEDPGLVKSFGTYLKSRGYVFIPLLNPNTILSRIKNQQPDIIILYLIKDQPRVLSVIRLLRERELKIPIIVISSHIDKKLIIELKSYDIKGLFVPPVKLEKLEAKIQTILSTKKAPSSSILIISEFETIKEESKSFIPLSVIEKHGFKIIAKISCNDAIEELKKPQNNIRMILVHVTNENQTLIIARLLKVVVSNLKIPVYFIADSFSQHLQDLLIKLGFINLISLKGAPSNELINMFESVLTNIRNGTRTLATQQRLNIIRNLKVIKTLPPLPDIYFKVEKLARDPNATSSDYSEILELDTGITARLLRMSNSAFFSFNRKIRSVKDAVALMGTREILSLVRLACITGNLKVKPEIEAAVKKVWEHSATCAIAAQLIFEKESISKDTELKENLFIGGIIHDIGKIVLWKFFPDIYLPIMLNPDVGSHLSVNKEKKFMGISHCEVGKALAEYWQLPELLSNVIAFHHKPSLKPESNLVMMIHISNIVSNLIMNIIPEDQVIGIDPELKKSGYTESKVLDIAHNFKSVIREKVDHAFSMIST